VTDSVHRPRTGASRVRSSPGSCRPAPGHPLHGGATGGYRSTTSTDHKNVDEIRASAIVAPEIVPCPSPDGGAPRGPTDLGGSPRGAVRRRRSDRHLPDAAAGPGRGRVEHGSWSGVSRDPGRRPRAEPAARSGSDGRSEPLPSAPTEQRRQGGAARDDEPWGAERRTLSVEEPFPKRTGAWSFGQEHGGVEFDATARRRYRTPGPNPVSNRPALLSPSFESRPHGVAP
jgi:hypothetical protein